MFEFYEYLTYALAGHVVVLAEDALLLAEALLRLSKCFGEAIAEAS